MTWKIIAHRGASALAKQENTLEAFQIAIDLGADYAEFDIRRTMDKQLIVFHDDNINSRLISCLTYDEVCRESDKNGFTVPLLSQVLKLCRGKIKLDVELKESGYEKEVINLILQDFSYDEFMMKSFIDTAVANIKRIDSNIKAGLLVGRANGDVKRRINEYFPERRLKQCNADFVSPNYKFVTRDFIRRMHLRKKDIYVWTVNSPELMAKLSKKKIDGIITDRPDLAMKERKDC